MVRVLAKICHFHGPGDLVSSQDAHLITGTVPALNPKIFDIESLTLNTNS